MIWLTIEDIAKGFGLTRREVEAVLDTTFGTTPRVRLLTISQVAEITPKLRQRLHPRGELQRKDLAHGR